MSTFYEVDLRVDSRDVDLFNHCRPSALLGILQEAATQAALALGVDGPTLLKNYNCLWMVTRTWAELDAPLHWNDVVKVKTWHRGRPGRPPTGTSTCSGTARASGRGSCSGSWWMWTAGSCSASRT